VVSEVPPIERGVRGGTTGVGSGEGSMHLIYLAGRHSLGVEQSRLVSTRGCMPSSCTMV